jgi:hypothetical protein
MTNAELAHLLRRAANVAYYCSVASEDPVAVARECAAAADELEPVAEQVWSLGRPVPVKVLEEPAAEPVE